MPEYYTDCLVEERISRKTMLGMGAWSIKEALSYQPNRIISKKPVKRNGQIIAWIVQYRYTGPGLPKKGKVKDG